MAKRSRHSTKKHYNVHFTAFLIVLVIMFIALFFLATQSNLLNVNVLGLVTQTIHSIISPPQNISTSPPSNTTNTTLITPRFTLFYEKGLPSSTLWSISSGTNIQYSNVNLINFSSTGALVSFTVNKVIINGCVFTPVPFSAATASGSTNQIVFSSSCTTTFTELGLPNDTAWGMSYSNLTRNSSSDSIGFDTGYGTFNFNVFQSSNSSCAYAPYPLSGSLQAGSSKTIVFLSLCANSTNSGVVFAETGLPTGYNWSVTYDNTTLSSVNPFIKFSTVSGHIYPFFNTSSINRNGCVFTPSPQSGGAIPGETVAINFTSECNTSFQETGLPFGLNWKVSYNGLTESSNSTSLNFNTSYSTSPATVNNVIVGNCTYIPSLNYSGSIASGSAVSVLFKSSCVSTFTEKNLPSGLSWTVNYDNKVVTSYSNKIQVITPNITTNFTIETTVNGGCIYTPTPNNGNLSSGSGQSVVFAQACHTVFTSTGLPSGISWAVEYDGSTRDGGYNSSIEFPYYANTTFGFNVSTIRLGNCTYTPSPQNGTIQGGALQNIVFSAACSTSFYESGLPSGDSWAVTYDNNTLSSTSTSVVFNGINGSYKYNLSDVPISGGCYYAPSPSSGTLTAGSNISILYSNVCTTTFIDPGLPQGANWTVTFAGATKHTLQQNVSFVLSPGKYYYQISQTSFGGCTYAPNETSGSTSVGQDVHVTFNLTSCDTVFSESGLPSGSSWQVKYDGSSVDSQSSSISFNNLPGNYSFSISPIVLGTCTFAPNESSGVIGAGSTPAIHFNSSCYTDFYENGLPSKSLWTVNYSDKNTSSVGTSMSISTPYSTYPYSVYNISAGPDCYYIPQPSTGTDSAGTSVTITYVRECVSTFKETGLYAGTPWSVVYNGINASSRSSSISILGVPGNYSYKIVNAYGYGCEFVPNETSSSLVSGNNVSLSFNATSCTTTLTEKGLPSGQSWNATFLAFNSTNSNTVSFVTGAGNYSLLVPHLNLSNCIFEASPPSVIRAGTSLNLQFHATCYSNITESGLPNGTKWTLNLTPSYNSLGYQTYPDQVYSTQKSYIEWISVNSTRNFVIDTIPINQKCHYEPQPSSGSVTAGHNMHISFYNSCITNFYEKGLPSGSKWAVDYNGINATSTSTIISFTTAVGVYSFRVYGVIFGGCYYLPNMTSGTINSSSTIGIGFVKKYCTTLFTESGLPSGYKWNVTYNSTVLSSTSSSISFNTTPSSSALSYVVSPTHLSSGNCYVNITSGNGTAVPGSTVSLQYINSCETTFTEAGLPSGDTWTVSYGGFTNSSSTSSIIIYALPGAHTFTPSIVGAGSGCFYQPSPVSGSLSAGSSSSITYSLECNTTFTELGLPGSARWSVDFGGSNHSATSSSIVFTTSTGSNSFTVPSVNFASCSYLPSPSSGTSVAGGNTTVSFTENTCNTTFYEKGLPTKTTWTIKYDGIQVSPSNNNITLTTPAGIFVLDAYKVKISGCVYSPSTYSSDIAAGSQFTIDFTASCSTNFTESGLPPSTYWFVDYNGTSVSSNTSMVSIPSQNGIYSYSVAYVGNSSCYYSPSPSSGNLVAGSALGVTYTGGCTTTFYENGLPLNTNWTVSYNGSSLHSTARSMQFVTGPGNHSYSISNITVDNCLYVGVPSSGNASAGSSITVVFNQTECSTVFKARGLASGLNWTINFGDSNYTQSSSSVTVTTRPGPVNLTAYSITSNNCTFNPSPSSAKIAAGSSIYINYTSSCITSFVEKGLPSGITWSAKYDGITNYSSTSGISITSIYGNFTFNIPRIQVSANCYLTPNPDTGHLVSGGAVSVNFSTYCLSQFSESGLPTGLKWSVTYDSITNSSNSADMLFNVLSGNYSYSIKAIKDGNCFYTPNSSSGYVNAGGYTSVKFTESACTSYFSESGLPSGTFWNVTFDSLINTSTKPIIQLNTSNGQYPFSIPSQIVAGCTYVPVPASGDIGAGSNTSITFNRDYCISHFNEIGLPSGFDWNVTLGPFNEVSNTSAISFNTTYSTYSYSTATIKYGQCEFIPNSTSGSTAAGSTVNIAFQSICKNYFFESGLPNGYYWHVSYYNTTKLPTTSEVEFTTAYGKFNLSILPTVVSNCGFTPNVTSRSLVSGSNLSVTFVNSSCQEPVVIPISFYNQNNVTLPNGYQQKLVFDSFNYSKYENANLSNIMFTYANGTVVPSWLESGNSNTSNDTVYWFKLAGIPSERGLTIHMILNQSFKKYAVDFNNRTTGEAQQLAPSYVNYSDIQNVMKSGLIYQIYYDSGSTSSGVSTAQESALYNASISSSTTISVGGQSFISSTPLFVVPGSTSSQNVDGTTRNYVINNLQGGYSGGAGFPNPPVANYGNAFMIKEIGFIALNRPIQFSVDIDDGGALGISNSTGNAYSWLGSSSVNQANILNEWVSESATVHSSSPVKTGDYGLEYSYINQGGPGYWSLWSNASLGYYYPLVLVDNLSAGTLVNTSLYTTTVTETGLPAGYNWTASYDGINKSTTSGSISFSTVSGSHNLYIRTLSNASSTPNCTSTYTPNITHSTETAGTTTQIKFFSSEFCTTLFLEKGLIGSPASNSFWSVAFDGKNISSAIPKVSVPKDIESYKILKIKNLQNVSTVPPLQQMVNVSNNIYSGLAASNFQNVEFFYINGTVIPSWLENYSYGKYSVYWLDLGTIPANSSISIYMGFAPNSTNVLNNLNTSISSQLGPYPQPSTGSQLPARLSENYTSCGNFFDMEEYPNGGGPNPSPNNMICSWVGGNVNIYMAGGSGGYSGLGITGVSNGKNYYSHFFNTPYCLSSYGSVYLPPGQYKLTTSRGNGGGSCGPGGFILTAPTIQISYPNNIMPTALFIYPTVAFGDGAINGAITISDTPYSNYTAAASTNLSCSIAPASVTAGSTFLFTGWNCTSTFVTLNIPSGYHFSVTFDNVTRSGRTGSPLNLSTISYTGLYNYNASTPSIGYNTSGKTYAGVTTQLSEWSVTKQFIETGLPVGATWYVNYNGTNKYSTSDLIDFIGSSQNLSFTIPSVVTGSAYIYVPNISSGFGQSTENTSISFTRENALTPAAVTSFIPINITNSQSTATTAPFQQMVNLSYSTYSAYANLSSGHQFQNVEFFNLTSGTLIDSWLENYTKNYALFWIKLPNGIPSKRTLDDMAVGFAQKNVSLFNKITTGEAPQLSLTGNYTLGLPGGSYAEQTNGFKWMNNATQPFTLSIWVNPASPNGVIIDEASPTASWHDSWVELVNGNIDMKVWNLGCVSLGSIPLDQWSNIVISGSLSGSTINYSGYVNGVYKGSGSGSRSVPGSTNLMYYPLGISDSTNCGSAASFVGSMENYQIYNKSLTTTAVTKLYSEGIYGAPVNSYGVSAWWPLNGSGNNLIQNNSIKLYGTSSYHRQDGYAKYDNGGDVFTNYFDFNGTALPNGWTNHNAGLLYPSDGLFWGQGISGYSTTTFSPPYIAEMYVKSTSYSGGDDGVLLMGPSIGSSNYWVGFGDGGSTNSPVYGYGANNAWLSSNLQALSLNFPYIFGYEAFNTSKSQYYLNYALKASDAIAANSQYLELWSNTGTSSVYKTYWIRFRQVPPNNVMPAVSTGQNYTVPITLALNGIRNENRTLSYGNQSNFTAVLSNTSEYVRLWNNISGVITPLTGFSRSRSTYLANLSAGTITVTAGTNSSGIRNITYTETISKATPFLALSVSPSINYTYNATNITVKAKVSTINNQLSAGLYINGKFNQTITSLKTINLGNSPGVYSVILNISGNANYSSSSVKITREIYPASSLVNYYIPLNITNSQLAATPAPFQQLINLSYAQYKAYINLSSDHQFQNVEFFNLTSGTLIDSWLENYTKNYALFWIKLPNGIPASTELSDVAVGFAPNTTNLFNQNTVGEAPQLSPSYGQYDNGAGIFSYYSRFGDMSVLPPGWNENGSPTTSFGTDYLKLTETNTGSWQGISKLFPAGVNKTAGVFEIYGNIYKSGTESNYQVLAGVGASMPAVAAAVGGYDDDTSQHPYWFTSLLSNVRQGGASGSAQLLNNSYVSGIAYNGLGTTKSNGVGYLNYQGQGTVTSTTSENVAYISVGLSGYGLESVYLYWLRLRAYPPNGSMPSVSFGPIVPKNITNYVMLTISNSQNKATSSPFQQMVNVSNKIYGKIANSNFQNVEFFYKNGTIIPSWLESYKYQNSALYWLRLGSIPSNGTQIAYLGFASNSTVLFNANTVGESPQLSSTYGQYDNGANVFVAYDNFTRLNSSIGWINAIGTVPSYTVNDGLTLHSTSTNTWEGLVLNTTYNATKYVMDSYAHFSSLSGVGEEIDMQTNQNSFSSSSTHHIGLTDENTVYASQNYNGSSSIVNTPINSLNFGVWSIYANNTYSKLSFNYTSTTNNGVDLPVLSSLYPSMESARSNISILIRYIRIRNQPPNGVMPTVKFSTLKLPSGITNYAKISIDNAQPVSESNYQQMINLSSNTFKGYAASNLQNVEFFYSNGTVIPSWLENYTYSKNALYWIKMNINADSIENIYVGFASNSTNLFNSNTVGEAPQLSSTYGQYDNGADVFPILYQNFAGTSVPTGWTSTGSITINNGVTSAYSSLLTTSASSYGDNSSQILDFYGKFPTPSQVDNPMAGYVSSSGFSNNNNPGSGFDLNTNIGSGLAIIVHTSSCNPYISTSFPLNTNTVFSIHTVSGSSTQFSYNYGAVDSLACGQTTQITVGISNDGSTGQTIGPFYWFRIRVNPPNGVMPSMIFGEVQ